MILSATTTDAAAEVWTLACDVCGDAMDPGALDAPHGGWSTQRAAYDAGETHGWWLTTDQHLCRDCWAGSAA